MKGFFPLLVYVFIFMLWIPFESSAQQADTVVLETVDVSEVIEKKYREATSFEFDSNQYNSGSLDVGEFLNGQSGMYVKDYGPGSTSSLSYRGNSAYHTKVYWDGISVDNVMLGQSDLSLLSINNGTKATFLRGGHSLMMSSGGFGGVLNVQTGNDRWKGMAFNTGVEYGSFNSIRVPASLFLGNGKWKLEAVINSVSSNNNYPYVNYQEKDVVEERENAAFDRLQFIPKVSYRLNDRHSFSMSYWYTLSERQVPSAIGTKHGNAYQTDLWNRSLFGYNYSSKKLKVEVKSNYSKDHLNYFNEALNIESLSEVMAFRNLMFVKSKLSSKIHLESQLRADQMSVTSNNYDGEKSQGIYSFYQSMNFNQKNYYIKPALRIEKQTGRNTYLLPSLDLGLAPLGQEKSFWLNLSYTNNVRFPSFNEQFWLNAGNPDLKEEIANSFEFGMSKQFMEKSKSSLFLQSTLFYSDVQNLIIWSPANNGIWIPQNLKAVINSGLELEAKYSIHIKNWRFIGQMAYTYVSSEVSQDEFIPENEGNQQMYIPKHKAFGNVSVLHKRYFLNYNHSYTGEVYTSNDNTEFLPFNSPANLEIGKKISMKNLLLTLSFSVKNLFDENYQYVLHQPMPMRHYFINIQFNYNKHN